MKDTLTKFDWLTALSCRTKSWLQLRTQKQPPTESERFRMEQGTQIGILAQQLFPQGVLIKSDAQKNQIEITRDLVNDPNTQVLYEAAFQHGPLTTKADLLVKTGKWLGGAGSKIQLLRL